VPLRFGNPYGRAPCCPHATEEESVVPPWWCRIRLHALRRLRNECLLEDVVDDGLDDDEPFFLEKRLVVFFHMVAALFSPLKLWVATGN
jgi:hypothetical protein